MRSISRLLVLALVCAVVAPGPATAGDHPLDARIAALSKLLDRLDQTKSALAELAKGQIDAGDLDGAKASMDSIDEIQELIVRYRDQLSRLRIQKGVVEARPPAPEDASPTPAAAAGNTLWYGGRGGHRNLKAEGGSKNTEAAVDFALEWLKNHQSPKGCWDCDGFSAQCRLNQCDGAGNALYDVGVTGLALMAFLGAGETDRHGNYQQTIARGLGYLQVLQDEEGCIPKRTSPHYIYGHAFATQAMAEAYALTGDPHYRVAAQKAVDFLLKAQNPYLAWRYDVRPQDNDTSVTACVICALHAAKQAGLRVDQAAFDGAKAWLDKVTEPEYGRVGYTARGTGPARPQEMMDRFPADKSESLTAAGIVMRVIFGVNPRKSEMIQKGADLCLRALPIWNQDAGSIDLYYWYYGSQAMFQVGGDIWKAWNAAMKTAVVDSQRKSGDEKGSWDPVGVWGREGGRIYSTALCTLMLETYYRQGRLFTSRFRRSFGRR